MSDKKNRPEIVHPQAEPFDAKHMVVARTAEYPLFVHLTEQEALHRGQEAARKRTQARDMAKALKDHTARVKGDIKSLENQAEHLEAECEMEAYETPVPCEVIFDYRKGEARTVRTDTGQVQRDMTRSLQKHELEQFQTQMFSSTQRGNLRSVPASAPELAVVTPESDSESAPEPTDILDGDTMDLDDEPANDESKSLVAGILAALQSAGEAGHTEPTLRAVLFGNGIVRSNDTKERAAIESELVVMRNDGRITGKKGKRWYIGDAR